MNIIRANLLLLLTAAIWGFAFVAQRAGMEYVGPFTFNGVRFLLGGLSLLPLLFFFSRNEPSPVKKSGVLFPGVLAGIVLFTAASLQQIGIVTTTAGKAAFITSLYIVLVPIISLFMGQTTSKGTWLGCVLSVVGLYFLCIKESSAIQFGDLLVLIGAFLWAVHILVIGYFSPRVDVLKLSFVQFMTCSALSLILAFITEEFVLSNLLAAAVPILYGGIGSVGIAYTLQAVGQKYARPAHAAIILSMEAVFAAIGGFLLLGEYLEIQEILGCFLMLSGMLVSQTQGMRTGKARPVNQFTEGKT
ncbi:MAG TPA: DMT family transporter [Syntrophomonadaceae bacterium]|nr:DMT family transporter [Syntrophomonadaceae bacterium]HRX20145.1 DMT family transporter [Syntrophomonadaceae bacterium]